jgi:hypothetical protein
MKSLNAVQADNDARSAITVAALWNLAIVFKVLTGPSLLLCEFSQK